MHVVAMYCCPSCCLPLVEGQGAVRADGLARPRMDVSEQWGVTARPAWLGEHHTTEGVIDWPTWKRDYRPRETRVPIDRDTELENL